MARTDDSSLRAMCAVDDCTAGLYIPLAVFRTLKIVARPARLLAVALLASFAMPLAAPQQSPKKPPSLVAPKPWGKSQPSTRYVVTDPRLAAIDPVIKDAIAKDEIPGAVLLVSNHGRVVWRKAYGSRAIIPQREPMTLDTIFDLASLTKVFATTAAVMKLIEQGKIRLNDPAVRYLPELGTEGATADKNQITIRQLL
ncbi:MAG TPA: serine hydrolase domain-containing protein, partial [Candidatus Acidoferrum sp.]|nr:serine hydrolase domain-containing protein [Candidatus Acidoferrum sp.]